MVTISDAPKRRGHDTIRGRLPAGGRTMTRTQTQARWSNHALIGLACVLIVSFASQAPAQTGAPVKKGSVEKVSVHGAALQGNLEGDSPDRDVFIYLPPSYATNRNRRYPFVYLLHEYAHIAERWMTLPTLP